MPDQSDAAGNAVESGELLGKHIQTEVVLRTAVIEQEYDVVAVIAVCRRVERQFEQNADGHRR